MQAERTSSDGDSESLEETAQLLESALSQYQPVTKGSASQTAATEALTQGRPLAHSGQQPAASEVSSEIVQQAVAPPSQGVANIEDSGYESDLMDVEEDLRPAPAGNEQPGIAPALPESGQSPQNALSQGLSSVEAPAVLMEVEPSSKQVATRQDSGQGLEEEANSSEMMLGIINGPRIATDLPSDLAMGDGEGSDNDGLGEPEPMLEDDPNDKMTDYLEPPPVAVGASPVDSSQIQLPPFDEDMEEAPEDDGVPTPPAGTPTPVPSRPEPSECEEGFDQMELGASEPFQMGAATYTEQDTACTEQAQTLKSRGLVRKASTKKRRGRVDKQSVGSAQSAARKRHKLGGKSRINSVKPDVEEQDTSLKPLFSPEMTEEERVALEKKLKARVIANMRARSREMEKKMERRRAKKRAQRTVRRPSTLGNSSLPTFEDNVDVSTSVPLEDEPAQEDKVAPLSLAPLSLAELHAARARILAGYSEEVRENWSGPLGNNVDMKTALHELAGAAAQPALDEPAEEEQENVQPAAPTHHESSISGAAEDDAVIVDDLVQEDEDEVPWEPPLSLDVLRAARRDILSRMSEETRENWSGPFGDNTDMKAALHSILR